MPHAPVTSTRVVPGWYGKIPSLGDFASRRLPDAFVQRWDSWLQEGLALARTELGAGWLDVYLVAPVRRFWLAPGVIGAAGWTGVMMSSVDRVGRYFPLTIAQAAPVLAEALAAPSWYAELEGVARQVLDVSFTVDDLEEALAEIPPLDAGADLLDLLDVPDPARGGDATGEATTIPAAATQADDACASVWWCADPPVLQRFATMPSASAFVSLLSRPP